jgi:hypothetical protein
LFLSLRNQTQDREVSSISFLDALWSDFIQSMRLSVIRLKRLSVFIGALVQCFCFLVGFDQSQGICSARTL